MKARGPLLRESTRPNIHKTTPGSTRPNAHVSVRMCAHPSPYLPFSFGVTAPESLIRNLTNLKTQGSKRFLSHKSHSDCLGRGRSLTPGKTGLISWQTCLCDSSYPAEDARSSPSTLCKRLFCWLPMQI